MTSTMFKLSSALLRRPAYVTQCLSQPKRDLNLLEYQAKGLLQDYEVTVQKFRVASNANEAENIPKEFPCNEYVIKAQVLAGGRGKGHFDNGFKVGEKSVLQNLTISISISYLGRSTFNQRGNKSSRVGQCYDW